MHRRPAGAEPGGAGEERGRRAEEGRLFEEGQPTPCQAVPLETLRKKLPVEIKGRYWGSGAEISGLVRSVQVRGREDIEVEVELQGTTTEPILRWASGASHKVMRVHMCGARCEAMLDAENLLHGEEIKVRKGEDPAWAMNLVEEAPAKEAEVVEAVEREEKRGAERGRSKEKDKKKKKRKKGRSSGEDKSPKEGEKKKSSARAMALQPICCQYFRQVLSTRLTGGQSREALTLSWCLDLLMQARIAEAADGLMQRLKAIEMTSQGASWSVSQKIELVPLEKPIISSRTEAREAIKESKEENRTRAEASKGKSKGDWSSSWRDAPWHQEKGKRKEGKGKGKKGKEKEQKKQET